MCNIQVTFTQAFLVEVWKVSAEALSFESWDFLSFRGKWPLKEVDEKKLKKKKRVGCIIEIYLFT